MVLLTVQGAAACQLLDQSGRLIGTVHRPAFDQVVGQGAGTVLLTRSLPRRVADERVTVSRTVTLFGMNWN